MDNTFEEELERNKSLEIKVINQLKLLKRAAKKRNEHILDLRKDCNQLNQLGK